MIYPILVLLFFFIIQFLKNNSKQNWDSGLKVLVIIISLLIIEFLRVYAQSIFGDIPNYRYIFDEIKPITNVFKEGYGVDYYYSGVELGYALFISIFKLISNDFNYFLQLISIIQLSVFYFFCKKFKIKIVNAVPIYLALIFITFQIGMLRQSLGFSFFLLGLVNLRKKYLYFTLVAIGCTFHISTVFCFLFFWVDKFVLRNIYYLLFVLSLYIYASKIDLLNNFSSYIDLIEIGNSGRTNYYLNIDRPSNHFGIGFWERIFYFILMNIIYSKLIKYNKINFYNNIIFNLGVSTILFQIIFWSTPTISSRLRYFIVIFPAIFISQYIYNTYKISKTNITYQAVFSSYLILYLYFLTTYLG